MPTPTLALCIPAYNAAEYLPRLLRSAAEQTVPFDEILVYNDCSTDDTATVAEAHGATVVSGDVNVGCSRGKNALAAHTQCDWIHFHDADDELYPDFVEKAQAWMTEPDPPEVVLFAYEYRDNDTNELLKLRTFDDAALRRDPVDYAIREQINPFCGLYQREAFLRAGGYDVDPDVLYNEDVAMHARLALAGLRFAADPAVTVINYRIGGSMSQSNQAKCHRAHYHVLTKISSQVGPEHHAALAEEFWRTAGLAGSVLDWETADASAEHARALGYPAPSTAGALFKSAVALHPRLALRLREHAIRRLRPHLRAAS